LAIKSTIFLRRAERDDLDTVVAWMDDPDFQHFLYGDPARSPRQIREQIAALLGRSPGNTMPGGIYLLIDSPDYGPVGLVSLQSISWRNRNCSVDLYIGNKKLRGSIMTAVSMYRAFEYCFDELNLHRVTAYIYSFNPRSFRLMEFTGVKREAVLREHVARDGQRHDLYCYGLLRSEFEQLRAEHAKRMPGKSLADMIAQQQEAADREEAEAEGARR
jgi:RimJ/RimL family protein N-acetyltransferase